MASYRSQQCYSTGEAAKPKEIQLVLRRRRRRSSAGTRRRLKLVVVVPSGKGYLGLIRDAVIEFNVRIEYFRLQRAERERGPGSDRREKSSKEQRRNERTSCVIGKASD